MFCVSTNTFSFEQKRNGLIPFGSINYKRVDVCLEEMFGYFQDGHMVTHDFGFNEFTVKQKRDDNFQSACFVSLDVDDCPIAMHEVVERITKKPTICFHTANNGYKGRGYRFRLVYVFDDAIDKHTYPLLVGAVENYIKTAIPNYDNSDRCTYSLSQQYCGADGNAEFRAYTYRIHDFPMSHLPSVQETHKRERVKIEFPDNQFFRDFNSMDRANFLIRYNHFLTPTHSLPISVDEGRGVEYYGDNYLEVFTKWDWRDNGRGKLVKYPHRFKDGENRRQRLFAMGLTFRKICKDITLESLVVDLSYQAFHFFDNSDNILDNKEIYDIAYRIMLKDYNSITIKAKRKKKFRIIGTMSYKAKRALVSKIGKELRYRNLLSIYDFSKSIRENERILKENSDYKPSYKTLRNFLIWVSNDINKKEREQYINTCLCRKVWSDDELGDVVDPDLSVTENIRECEKIGIKVSQYRMRKFFDDNGIERKHFGKRNKS